MKPEILRAVDQKMRERKGHQKRSVALSMIHSLVHDHLIVQLPPFPIVLPPANTLHSPPDSFDPPRDGTRLLFPLIRLALLRLGILYRLIQPDATARGVDSFFRGHVVQRVVPQ